jgi:hypothetical protein
MESIRARYADRINGTYNNSGITGTFKELGLWNNDSSTLTVNSTTNAIAGTFIATRLRDAGVAAATPPAAAAGGAEKLHSYRHEAWNEANHNATHKKDYVDANPAGYVVEPLDISSPGGAAAGGAAATTPPAAFIAKRTDDKTLHWYRHEAWNEANHNATHIAEYTADTPAAGY